MQPYFYPYIGYWRLLALVDKFVILDDVNYINRGWVNRNRVLVNGGVSYITVPLKNASQNRRISDIELVSDFNWRSKILKTLELNYRKSSAFDEVFPVLERLIKFNSPSLVEYLVCQIEGVSKFIGLNVQFVRSSMLYQNQYLRGQDRIINICERESADVYINLPGGRALYDEKSFLARGIDLRFISDNQLAYKQRSTEFVPFMSIIDLLMEVGSKGVEFYLGVSENKNLYNGMK